MSPSSGAGKMPAWSQRGQDGRATRAPGHPRVRPAIVMAVRSQFLLYHLLLKLIRFAFDRSYTSVLQHQVAGTQANENHAENTAAHPRLTQG